MQDPGLLSQGAEPLARLAHLLSQLQSQLQHMAPPAKAQLAELVAVLSAHVPAADEQEGAAVAVEGSAAAPASLPTLLGELLDVLVQAWHHSHYRE